jgi:DnaK suppressor protein
MAMGASLDILLNTSARVSYGYPASRKRLVDLSLPTYRPFLETVFMNRTQLLEQLKQDLLYRREVLSAALAGDLQMLQEIRRSGGDVVDFAADSAAEVLSSQLAEAESRELANIELALVKIKKNCYGKCEECGKSIAWPRLEALPYAAHCIECQTLIEQREPDFDYHDSPSLPIASPPPSVGFRSSDYV